MTFTKQSLLICFSAFLYGSTAHATAEVTLIPEENAFYYNEKNGLFNEVVPIYACIQQSNHQTKKVVFVPKTTQPSTSCE